MWSCRTFARESVHRPFSSTCFFYIITGFHKSAVIKQLGRILTNANIICAALFQVRWLSKVTVENSTLIIVVSFLTTSLSVAQSLIRLWVKRVLLYLLFYMRQETYKSINSRLGPIQTPDNWVKCVSTGTYEWPPSLPTSTFSREWLLHKQWLVWPTSNMNNQNKRCSKELLISFPSECVQNSIWIKLSLLTRNYSVEYHVTAKNWPTSIMFLR